MSDYGVTDKGFVLKRLDTILEEVHGELTEGFGIDTRLSESTFLNVLVTTFCNQIAELWESAQDEYYSKYPSTASGVNLDYAVQYGGIRREKSQQSIYSLHCTGDDGTTVRAGTMVATDTKPETRLYAASDFVITRSACSSATVKVAVAQLGETYTVSINGANYSYVSEKAEVLSILQGLKDAIVVNDFNVTLDEESMLLTIEDTDISRVNVIALTENLTTESVTSIASFYTEDYGKIILPNGIVSKIVNNISGFESVTNKLVPIYGRLQETDIELRQSYLAKAAIRSNTMLESIEAELLNNVIGVETASGHENDTDEVNERGMPPHSIELVVEGGDNYAVADAILRRKAGGIQTYGSITVDVVRPNGNIIPISFNRPEYLYTWIKVVLHGDDIPENFATLVQNSVVSDTQYIESGTSLLIQQLNEGIYREVPGVTYVDIYTYSGTDETAPSENDYAIKNVVATSRQKILVEKSRIEVSLYDA